MNIPLLRRIQHQIDKTPHLFAMAHATSETECGTAYCILGWACVLVTGAAYPEYGITVRERGTKLLDVSEAAADRLFFKDRWPEKFQKGAEGSEELAGAALRRIDHFIATAGEE
jgi:hypothetical protein